MKIFSCESHIDQVLDDFIVKYEEFPIMEMVAEEEKLPTNCTRCDLPALYVVGNK